MMLEVTSETLLYLTLGWVGHRFVRLQANVIFLYFFHFLEIHSDYILTCHSHFKEVLTTIFLIPQS